ncbi:acyltransferase family protein [Pseudomonadota bacterium]
MTFESIAKQDNPVRIQYLDGLRGLAILMVVLFHAFSRWPDIVPFGNRFATFPLFKNGWLGVQLFFLISGYVIHMTLDKSRSPVNFLYRRWLRLFPAMLFCSLIIFFTAPFFFERPAGSPMMRDLLPGLTFIEPFWWKKFLGPPQGQLEGAFWSLYVEVKFYLIASIFYFISGGKKMIWILCILFLSSVALPYLSELLPNLDWFLPRRILFILSAEHLGWFAAGALFYLYSGKHHLNLLVLAVATGLISALTMKEVETQAIYSGFIVVLIFTASVLSQRVQSWLSNPVLLTLGFASYPLYLLHENMMISLIVKTGNFAPWIPAILVPVIPMSIVIALGWMVARYAEPKIRNSIIYFYPYKTRPFRPS